MSDTIVYPSYYRVIRCDRGRWFVKSAMLCSPNNVSAGMEGTERYGVSADTLLVELFRINGGFSGYYIANLRDKLYYYCGSTLDDVRRQFLSLGIGRTEN